MLIFLGFGLGWMSLIMSQSVSDQSVTPTLQVLWPLPPQLPTPAAACVLCVSDCMVICLNLFLQVHSNPLSHTSIFRSAMDSAASTSTSSSCLCVVFRSYLLVGIAQSTSCIVQYTLSQERSRTSLSNICCGSCGVVAAPDSHFACLEDACLEDFSELFWTYIDSFSIGCHSSNVTWCVSESVSYSFSKA